MSLLAVYLGLVYYGLLEYTIHRWIFHGNWLSDENPMKKGHASHHEFLQQPIAQPFFFPVIIGLVHWAPLSVLLPEYFVSYILFGLFTGYLYYGLLHHVMHSGYKHRSRYFRRLAAFHVLHHKYPESNFGIIATMWDRLFDSRFQVMNSSPH
jgi:4-hydroxysphinganine ceramide fatty acyl 2-hydroxylase